MIGKLKANWRLVLLVVVVLMAGFALFSPSIGAPDDDELGNESQQAEGFTNLVYGLDLAGGTRIRAPLIGMTAEGVDFGGDNEAAVAAAVADELPDTDTTDVIARQEFEDEPGTVEMVDPDVSESEFGDAMDAAGYEYDEIRDGVTAATREEAIEVLEGQVNQAGLSGSTVQEVSTATGEFFILVEVPGQERQDVIDLIQDRGNVRVDIYHQDDNGSYTTERAALTRDDFQSVSTATQNDQSGPHVPVTVRQDSAEEFQQKAVDTGLAQEGAARGVPTMMILKTPSRVCCLFPTAKSSTPSE